MRLKFTTNNGNVPITLGDTTQYTSTGSPHITIFPTASIGQQYDIGTGANINDKVIIVNVIDDED